jgi:hypothetical protein
MQTHYQETGQEGGDAEHSGHRRLPTAIAMRMALFDAAEAIFGPDPGLIRLKLASRAVFSAAFTMTVLLLVTNAASRGEVTAIALGFMVAIISNIAVRDEQPAQQAVTLALLALPALGAIALASYLSNWPWLGDMTFVAVATLASLARMFGPRGMAVGFVAFIVYFIGEIIHPPLADMPLLTLGIGLGLATSALMRFAILPDNALATMHHVAWHLRRRVARILAEAAGMLAQERSSAPLRKRMHGELARLNDTLVIADQQIGDLGRVQEVNALRDRALAVELAAERVLRIAGGGRAEDREGNSARLGALAHRLRTGQLPAARSGPEPAEAPDRYHRAPLGAALDALESALAGLEQATR